MPTSPAYNLKMQVDEVSRYGVFGHSRQRDRIIFVPQNLSVVPKEAKILSQMIDGTEVTILEFNQMGGHQKVECEYYQVG